jgi:hypothetical protein
MIDKDADPEHWKKIIFVIILEVPDEKSRIQRRIHIRNSKNITDQEHCNIENLTLVLPQG